MGLDNALGQEDTTYTKDWVEEPTNQELAVIEKELKLSALLEQCLVAFSTIPDTHFAETSTYALAAKIDAALREI